MRIISTKNLGKVILSQLSMLEKERGDLLRNPSDAESVHRMRVSTRRFREALIFLREAVKEERAKDLVDEARLLTKGLGACRSIDVSGGLLKAEFSRSQAMTVQFVTAWLKEKRERKEKRLMETVMRHKMLRFRQVLQAVLKKVDEQFERRWFKTVKRILRKRRRQIKESLEETDLSKKKNLHRLRIGVKKLRYDLEVVEAMGNISRQKSLDLLKKHQRVLGHWHDYEVLRGHLKELLRRQDFRSDKTWAPKVRFLCRQVGEKAKELERFVLKMVKKNAKKLIKAA